MSATPIVLRTPRLLMRQWREEDLAVLIAMGESPKVMAHYPSTLTPVQCEAMWQRLYEGIAERGWGLWATERLDTGELIGFVGITPPRHRTPYDPCIEIGWRLLESHWRQGFATEAAQAALRFGFEELALGEILAWTSLGNQRSQAVMERLGMIRDETTFEHPALPPGSHLREHCVYRLSVARWREAPPH
ncbi:MAG: GNAT family N-acetyltransferase [Pseudomonadota bacterium]